VSEICDQQSGIGSAVQFLGVILPVLHIHLYLDAGDARWTLLLFCNE
jgi:hypothetical protein